MRSVQAEIIIGYFAQEATELLFSRINGDS